MSLPGLLQASSKSMPQGRTQSDTNQSDPLAEFDEYGTELRPDARVWRVYVEEADKYDKELVEGWKSSIDLILVFAALFSAISTAFLIESSKKLQEDPADVSAQSLLLIAQTLRALTNGTDSSSTTTSVSSDDNGFTPTRTAIAINTLWYLSLSLSLATAFISILAKDWCNSFLAGRTGHHYEQTERRQQKWDMIERWRMPELVTVLPSLIHTALLLFAIGLCIYLWDMNVTVAIPVICVSGVATSFYIWSSIMDIFINSFPYPTIISRTYRSAPVQYLVRLFRSALVRLFRRVLVQYLGRHMRRGLRMTLRALLDLPSNLEDFIGDNRSLFLMDRPDWYPKNIYATIFRFTLQGACFLCLTVPLIIALFLLYVTRIIVKWVWKRLRQRLPTIRISHAKRADITSLALSWLIKTCETPRSIDIALQSIAGANQGIAAKPLQECKASLQILQRLASSSLYKDPSKTETIISLYSRALSFLGKRPNSSAQSEAGGDLEVLIWDLQVETEKKVAELVTGGSFKPTKPNLNALRLGNTAASRSLRLWKGDQLSHHHDTDNIDDLLKSIGELLESYLNSPNSLHDGALLSLVHAASLLSLFVPNSPAASALALPCVKLANSKHDSDGLISALASTCALACNKSPDQNQLNSPHGLAWTERAVRALVKMHSQEAKALAKFSDCALQELVTHQEAYQIENLDSTVQNSLVKYNFSNAQGYENFWVRDLDRWWDWRRNEAPVYLRALQDVSDLTPATTPRPHAHLLVHEVMCRAWNLDSSSWDYCKQLISKCSFTKLSSRLTWVLDQREIIPLLERMRASNLPITSRPAIRFFATGQLWLLFTLSLDTSENTERDRNQLRHKLHRYDEDGPHLEDIDRHKRLGKEIEQFWSEDRERIIRKLGVWAYRLMECVLQSQNRDLSEDLQQRLADVPEELRGLQSFTQWRPRAIEPSATDAQAGEEGVGDVPDTTGRTPAATAERAIDGDQVADDEATPAANEVWEREDEGQVDVNAGHETTGEGGETAVGGQANSEARNGETSRPEDEGDGTTDGRQEMGGLMLGGGQGTEEGETGTRDEGQETRQDQSRTGEAECGTRPHIAIDIPDTESAAK